MTSNTDLLGSSVASSMGQPKIMSSHLTVFSSHRKLLQCIHNPLKCITTYMYIPAELMHDVSSVRSTPGVESEHTREASESRVISMSTVGRYGVNTARPRNSVQSVAVLYIK